jgi:hypothetical protein
MRDFTRFSGLLERDEIISLINEVFETTECILRNHGREILKFMGDGLLGIFTTTGLAPKGKKSFLCVARLEKLLQKFNNGCMTLDDQEPRKACRESKWALGFIMEKLVWLPKGRKVFFVWPGSRSCCRSSTTAA